MQLTTKDIEALFKSRTVTYDPVFVEGVNRTSRTGAYVAFYIFTNSSKPVVIPSGNSACVLRAMSKLCKSNSMFKIPQGYVKSGAFTSGAKSRYATSKSDLIKPNGNGVPAARYCQFMLNGSNLYLHYVMVVVTDKADEKAVREAVKGYVTVNNEHASPMRRTAWQRPVNHPQHVSISKSVASKLSTNSR